MIQLSEYTILFEADAWEALRGFLAKKVQDEIFVLVDENTAVHCLPILREAVQISELKVIQVASGEAHKTIDTCQFIWTQLAQMRASRKAVLLNLGGGVIGDMGGFCAATYKRGIDFIQIPTTLLSQVDASVGGKLGVDFGLIKNGIGLFQNPKTVCISTMFFNTLPEAEIRSGFAEILKHALIADRSYWQQLQMVDLSQGNWSAVVEQSIRIKKDIVKQDPFEKGLRKVLNFGHTIGHAIESLSWQSSAPLLHGEAVAIGMLAEAYISHQLLGLDADMLQQIALTITKIYPYWDIDLLDVDQILLLIQQDKKNEGKQRAFSLISSIGQASFNHVVNDDLIKASLDYYKSVYKHSKTH